MRISDVVSLGIDRAIDMVVKQQMPSGFVWTAVKGAWKYVIAVARGDEAHHVAQNERLLSCKSCQSIDWTDTSQINLRAAYCGKGETHGPNPTCGCLVAITVDGRMEPAGKLQVASEHCPQDKWHASQRIIR